MGKILFYTAMAVVFIGLTGLFVSNIEKDKSLDDRLKNIDQDKCRLNSINAEYIKKIQCLEAENRKLKFIDSINKHDINILCGMINKYKE